MDVSLVAFAPFAMVVAIVWIIANAKTRRGEMNRAASGDDAVIAQMQHQIDRLTDRVQVLEKLVTDDDRRLSREIDGLRDRGRPPV
jgi:phage shock protein B